MKFIKILMKLRKDYNMYIIINKEFNYKAFNTIALSPLSLEPIIKNRELIHQEIKRE